jgi:hypothetical protein
MVKLLLGHQKIDVNARSEGEMRLCVQPAAPDTELRAP